MAMTYRVERDAEDSQNLVGDLTLFADNRSALAYMQQYLGDAVMDGAEVHYANEDGWEVHDPNIGVHGMRASYQPDIDATTDAKDRPMHLGYIMPYSDTRDPRVECTCPGNDSGPGQFRCRGHRAVWNENTGDGWRRLTDSPRVVRQESSDADS